MKKKSNKPKRVLILSLAVSLVLSNTSVFSDLVIAKGDESMISDEIGYSITQELSEDGTSAKVLLKVEEKEGIQLQKITLPDGAAVTTDSDGKPFGDAMNNNSEKQFYYDVVKNGPVEFAIKYYLMDSAVSKEEMIIYEVTDIRNAENEEKSTDETVLEEGTEPDSGDNNLQDNSVPETDVAVDSTIDGIQYAVEGAYFIFDPTTQTITGYSSSSEAPKDITIPSSINGVAVRHIGNGAFSGQQLTGLKLNESLESIGDNAFFGNEGISGKLIIPSSVTSIGTSAFKNCAGLETVTVLASVTEIKNETFSGCTNLQTVVLPTGIAAIGESAFDQCRNLSVINIPEGVESIGAYAFRGTASLTAVVFPNSLRTIGDTAFGEAKLENIILPDNLNQLGFRAFYGNENLTSVRLSGGVENLSAEIFRGCNSLTELIIPEGVKTIGNRIVDATSVAKVTLPSTIEAIDSEAFAQSNTDPGKLISEIDFTTKKEGSVTGEPWGASRATVQWQDTVKTDSFIFAPSSKTITKYIGSATTVDVPEKFNVGGEDIPVERIGEYAFIDQTAITKVTLPHTIKEIGKGAFKGDDKLSEIVIQAGVRKIGDEAFYECQALTGLTLPEGVTDLGINMLMNCFNLKEVRLPDGLEIIPESTFFNCTSLEEISIPDTVKTIGNRTFWNTKIAKVTIPASVTVIGWDAMASDSIKEVYIPDKMTGEIEGGPWGSKNAVIYWKDVVEVDDFAFSTSTNTILKYIGAGGDIVIPSSFDVAGNDVPVYEIGNGTFKGNTSIQSVMFFEGLRVIGEQAFLDCTGINQPIVFPDSLKAIGSQAFWAATMPGKITVPAGVEKIGSNAFRGCQKIDEVEIEEGFAGSDIGENVFAYCIGIKKSVILSDSMTIIGSSMFNECTGIEKVRLGKALTSISDSAFSGCTSLNNIIIPEKVTKIEGNAFSGCSSLTNISFSDALKSIGGGAFANTSVGGDIHLPAQLETLGGESFANCTGITSVRIENKIQSIAHTAFLGAANVKNIFVDLVRGAAPANVSANQPWGASNQTEQTKVFYRGETVTFEADIAKGTEQYKRVINISAYIENGTIAQVKLPDNNTISVGGTKWPSDGLKHNYEVTENGTYIFTGSSASGDEVIYTVVIDDIQKPVVHAEDASIPYVKLSELTKDKLYKLINASATDEENNNVPYEVSDHDLEKVKALGNGGNTTITVTAKSDTGLKDSKTVIITVLKDEEPQIKAPDVVTMNVGDFWNPLDPAIVEGLSLSDDYDSVTVNDLTVQDGVEVGAKFLSFFVTKDTGELTKAGTYKVVYSYTDKSGNKAEKEMVVKVNGKPYLTDTKGNELTQENMPNFYFRVGGSLDPFYDVKAYYEKASDTVGEAASPSEIKEDDPTTGSFRVGDPVDSQGNSVSGSPSEAGKYTGTYLVKTNSEARSTEEIPFTRTLYAQGKIEFSGQSISYPASSGIHSFTNWNDFYEKYKDELKLSAKVKTPKEDGTAKSKDLLDTLEVIDPISKNELDFGTLDFSLSPGETSKEIELRLRVTDDGKTDWKPDGTSVYKEESKEIALVITVQNNVGKPPEIEVKNLERVTTDEIRDINSSDPDKDLSSGEVDQVTRPLYHRLLNDVTFTDEDGTVLKKEILTIKRTSSNPDTPRQAEYDPGNEQEIKNMMMTVGTYAVRYRATDDKNNTTTAERTIFVSGPTVFVSNMKDMTLPVSEINTLESDTDYIPGGVFAYHLNYDESTPHETTVLPNIQSLDIQTPGTYQVTFKTAHHLLTYPDGTTRRPEDEFVQIIKVNGNITFDLSEVDGGKEERFGDQPLNLDAAKATYLKAQNRVGTNPVPTEITVTHDQQSSFLPSTLDQFGSYDVTFRADASADSQISSHKAGLTKNYKFYALRISDRIPESIRVKTDITPEELKNAVGIWGQVTLPDTSARIVPAEYDFTHMNDSTEPYVKGKVSYTLDNGTTRKLEKRVNLEKVAKPILNADDIVYNVGDKLDLISDSHLKGSYDGQEIKVTDIKYNEIVPVDGNGNVNAAGTYQVNFTYEDTAIGNKGTKEILVKVNGIPVIHEIPVEMVKRTGDDLNVWQTAYVTWLKAPDSGGAAVEERFDYSNASEKGAKFKLENMKNAVTGAPVDFSSLNVAGYYSGDYYAETPTGGKTKETHTLLLHGKPMIESATSITISKFEQVPDDFLEKFKDVLGINASVKRAYTDKLAEEVDLTSQVSVSQEELNKIKYGTVGDYTIEVSVTDTESVPGSKYNSVTRPVTVNIRDVVGTAPVITTPVSVQRVEGDAIGLNDESADSIAAYLLDKVSYEDFEGNRIIEKKIISVRKTAGPPDNSIGNIENPDNEALKKIMNTVGEYQAMIQVTDEKANPVTAPLKIEVAGKTEFGYDQDGTFVKLGDTLSIRQSNITYSFDGIYARHMDPGGTCDRVAINKGADVDISGVSVKELTISAPHHYPYYDDDGSRPRGNDTFSYRLLVQGRIEFYNAEEIHTRVGTEVDPLKAVITEDDEREVYASFQMIDENGFIHEEKIKPTAVKPDTSEIGENEILLTAVDTLSGAANNRAEIRRKVLVSSIPKVDYKPTFKAGSNAVLKDLVDGAQINVVYQNSKGQMVSVPEGDVTIGYQDTLEQIKANGAGREYDLDITVRYLDNGIEKELKETSKVYVLNDPHVLVQIPKYLELKDDGTGMISARADVTLYSGDDLDAGKDKVSAIAISADSEIRLGKDTEEFTVYTYKKDGTTPYEDSTQPITTLKYGGNESDYFYLKAEKGEASKEIGLYQGSLNIVMKYEGN